MLPPVNQLTLKDGKSKDLPADYRTAIRVRALDKNDDLASGDGQFLLLLQVSPEPKITWQSLVNLSIKKAVDDQDQTLVQGAAEMPHIVNRRQPPPTGIYSSGLHQNIPLYFKKGAKNSKTLKELTGVLQATVLTPAKAIITTGDVFKSANKTFRGENGSIKILDVQKDDKGQVKVKYELQAPPEVFPPQNAGGGQGIGIQMVVPPQGGPAVILPQGLQVIQIQVQGNVAAALPCSLPTVLLPASASKMKKAKRSLQRSISNGSATATPCRRRAPPSSSYRKTKRLRN